MTFDSADRLSADKMGKVRASLEVTNETPITGYVTSPGSSEIKRRIYDTFPTQNRAVTQADYENIVYRMPAKFGSIKRCAVYKDQDSLKRNLNMYVISEDKFGKLIKTNNTIKTNLKTWINNYRMINDTVDILDPYIINLGIDFEIRIQSGVNKNDALGAAFNAIKKKFSEGYFISQDFSVSDVYSELKNITGILDVTNVKITNKVGGQYSPVTFNVSKNISQDGSMVLSPANAIFEIKYPSSDIRGKVK
jgi:hypothetical protein